MLLTLTTLLAWGVDRTALPGLTGGALLLFWLGGTSTVVAMNHRLFRFFARCRGSAFALAAIPMHLLYFFYSGIAFGMGTFLFATRALDARVARVARVAIDELEPEKEKTTAIEPL
jgi:hypothetical protein